MSGRLRLPAGLLPAAVLAAILFAVPPLVGGCALAAVGVAAIAVSSEFVTNAQVAYIEEDHRVVWAQAKRTLAFKTQDPIEVDEDFQAATANVSGARVTVHVEIFDVGQTKLSVGAKKWGFYDEAVANEVITGIKKDLRR